MNKKKVIFCTYPSIYSSLVLKKLLLDDHIEVVAIISSSRVLSKKYGLIRSSLKQIQLSGWRYSTYLFLVTDLFSLLSFFSKKESLKTVKHYAKKRHIPVLETPDINQQPVVDFILNSESDFLLAAHFNQLIKAPILGISGLSCLNIHPSLLPNFKGVDPVFFALLNEEERLGVSLHQMAESFDTGKIYSQHHFSSKMYDTVFAHNCRLFESGAELAIEEIKNKSNKVWPQSDGSYDSWPNPAQVKQFRRMGSKLLKLNEYFHRLLKKHP